LDWRRVRRAEHERLTALRNLLNLAGAATRPARRLAVAA